MEFSRFRKGTDTFPAQLSALIVTELFRQVKLPQKHACCGTIEGRDVEPGTIIKEAPKLQNRAAAEKSRKIVLLSFPKQISLMENVTR